MHEDKIKPWRYQSWQKSTDPQCVEKAVPVLERDEQAQALTTQAEAVCCVDEKTSLQARQRVSTTKAAVPAFPMQIADRYRRMGALNLFWALMVATGMTFAQCCTKRCFAAFQTFLLALFTSAICHGLNVLHQ